MKKRHYALMLVAAVFLIGFLFWLFRPPPAAVIRHISLNVITNGVSPGMANFRLNNDESRPIFVSDLFVEIKTSGSWQAYQQIVPDDSRVVAPGASKDLTVPVPTVNGEWRLRATYGDEMRGVSLFLLKVEIGVEKRRIPGPGFGGFSGQSSAISPEMKNDRVFPLKSARQ